MTETRVCQNCKNQFTIEPEDFAFYEKIKVPPPTWCPEYRMVRRMLFRNERVFHKRKCDLCGKEMITFFGESSPYRVYCNPCWYSEKWDGFDYGREYDSTKPFLQQFHELNLNVPQRALISTKSINSEYTNFSPENKNCYMCVSTLQSENCIHGSRVFYSRDSLDCLEIQKCELCYDCIHCEDCNKAKHCAYSQDLVDCAYCYDCRGLINCFGCVGLRSKSCYWLNKSLSKDGFRRKVEELKNTGMLTAFLAEYAKLLLTYPRKYARITNSFHASGENLIDCKNSSMCFFARALENSRYVFTGTHLKDCRDLLSDDYSELSYELMSAYQEYDVAFCTICWSCQNVRYSNLCFDSSNLLGCVGLRKKSCCILNRQYSAEEYKQLSASIISNMQNNPYRDKIGRVYSYGEFFPVEFSSFPYNETVAQEHFPLTEAEAAERGYAWAKPAARNYQITISSSQVPQNIQTVPDAITQDIIGCAHAGKCNEQCTTAFRIIPSELALMRRMDVPAPNLCPHCRHAARLKKRNPPKLWKRQCMCAGQASSLQQPAYSSQPPATSQQHGNAGSQKLEAGSYVNTASHFHQQNPCPNTFQTSYAPERPEIVYCEQCYNAEVV